MLWRVGGVLLLAVVITAAPTATPRRQLLQTTDCGGTYCNASQYCDWGIYACLGCPPERSSCQNEAQPEYCANQCFIQCGSGTPDPQDTVGHPECTGSTYCDWSTGTMGGYCVSCPFDLNDCNATVLNSDRGIMDCYSKCSGAALGAG